MTIITKTGMPFGTFRGQRDLVVRYLRDAQEPVTLEQIVADLTPTYEPLINEWAKANGGVRVSILFHLKKLEKLGQVKLEGRGEPEASDARAVSEPTEEVDQNAFALGKYLEDFIVCNFAAIFKGNLRIYEDENGSDGQQYQTDIGPIDILAVEAGSRSFVVIELKKGRPSDQVVGQILRYMGWVKKNLCREGQEVKGLVICREPDPKLSYAIEMTNNINVRYYKVSFTLS
ncbi:MAG: endonuclease NucS domain-containing protein [Terriglobales bacterium]